MLDYAFMGLGPHNVLLQAEYTARTIRSRVTGSVYLTMVAPSRDCSAL